MTDLIRHLCWSPETAAATISTEAVAPSLPVFLATHAPLRIHRRSADIRTAEIASPEVDEEVVRHDFLNRSPANGVLLMPLIGESGAGKSHLVRWVKEKTPPTDRRHVIYLPKTGTSLRTVVDRLLDGMDDARLSHLREEVARTSGELDQTALEQRLLNQMQEALASADPGTERVLAGPQGLAVLLLDPHVREHLLQPHKLIPRRAAHLLLDRAEGDPDLPLTFSLEDLPLDIPDMDQKASARAKKLFSIIKVRPQLQTAAVEMLNGCLDLAAMNAMNLGVGRLQQAMLEVRRELARQGREIVLLIEDFALIQSVQRDLLDAIIETGVRDGRTQLAPIRTLMAVTTGYYARLADTVVTRAKSATPYVYDLDVQFRDDDSVGVTAFVGRYLNAARLGTAAFDRAIEDSAVEPNACTDCPLQSDCHAAFGASTEGHGLYPFNGSALRRAIHSRAPRDRPRTFNPRAVIGEVVRTVLIEHAQSIREGTFPDPSFREQCPTAPIDTPLSSAVCRAINDADPANGTRRAVVLEMWGDAPTGTVDLNPVLHEAFALPLLHLDKHSAPMPQPSPVASATVSSPTGPEEGLSPAVRQHIENIEAWFTRDVPLKNATALEIRSIVGDAVMNACRWNQPLMAEPVKAVKDRTWPAKSTIVSIEGAESQRLPGTDQAPIKFGRTSRDAQFFQGLLRARAGQVAGSAEHVRRLAGIAEEHELSLIERVQAVQGSNDVGLVLAMRASALGAALMGRAWPGMNDAELLGAVLDDGQTWSRQDASLRTPHWQQIAQQHMGARAGLVLSLRKGAGIQRGVAGAVRMVDAARLLPLLREATADWAWSTPQQDLPEAVRPAVGRFADWDGLVDAQVRAAEEWLRGVRRLLPKGTRGRETVSAVETALDAAIPVALAPRDDLERLRRLIADAVSLDWKVVDQIESDIQRAHSTESVAQARFARIAAAVRDRGPDVEAITGFLQTSDAWLTEKLAEARMRTSQVGDTARNRVRTALREWEEITSEAGE